MCEASGDYRLDTDPVTVDATVTPGASVEVLASGGHTELEKIPVDSFPSYLSGDHGTRTFVVSGPLYGITGLAEQLPS